MNLYPSLLGSWVNLPEDRFASNDVSNCVWHVVDERTCVYEQRTEMGIMVSWFQYWAHEGGFFRFPLSNNSRSMFKTAEYVSVTVGFDHLLMNGCRFDLVRGLAIPERYDLFPGTRPDENGCPAPHTFKAKLQEHLPNPPGA